jgi:hypothetical protein
MLMHCKTMQWDLELNRWSRSVTSFRSDSDEPTAWLCGGSRAKAARAGQRVKNMMKHNCR